MNWAVPARIVADQGDLGRIEAHGSLPAPVNRLRPPDSIKVAVALFAFPLSSKPTV